MKTISKKGRMAVSTFLFLTLMAASIYSFIGYSLTIQLGGTGGGKVTGTVMYNMPTQSLVETAPMITAPIDCGTTCTVNFAGTALVNLTAVPNPGSVFVRWVNTSPALRTERLDDLQQVPPFNCSGTNPNLAGSITNGGTIYCRADFNSSYSAITAPALNLWGLAVFGMTLFGIAVWRLRF